MHIKRGNLKFILLFVFIAIQVIAQNEDVINTSFENYFLGNLNGQENWKVENGSGTIVSDTNWVYTGEKALLFTANNSKLVIKNSFFSGDETGKRGVVYLDLYVKINKLTDKAFAINGYDLFGGSSKRAFVLEFAEPSGNTGTFRIYDGSSKTNVGDYLLGKWNRISARIDFDKEFYQVVFNSFPAVTVNFRESYTPKASGSREANVKEFHEIRFNLGYDGATGTVESAIDDIYIGKNPIAGIEFPEVKLNYKIDVEQPKVGEITLNPAMEEYPESTLVKATLTLPEGYKNFGWTGDLSGTELVKELILTGNLSIGANVGIDPDNPPQKFHVNIIQPDTGYISIEPSDSIFYDFTNVKVSVSVPVGYKFEGWTGDLSGTEPEVSFVIHQDMTIGANITLDTTPPQIYEVTTASELKSVCKGTNLKPGDIVEVADGVYSTSGITIESSGTESKPIIIRAKNPGKAELSGETYFTLRKAGFITIEGFYFTSSKYTVIKMEACNNIRITNNIFELTEQEGKNGKWVYIGGYWSDKSLLSHHNRIDHNIFRNKHQLGNFITIDGGNQVSQHDRIDHNYFYNIGPRHENEMEAIRVGWSELSLTDGFTVIEYNLFEECDGDPEIVSIKSCKDTIRYNTFRRSQGTLSLRHGDGSVVYGNFFFGEGKEGTGGIRVYARNHLIFNNYFEGLKGYTWDAAITLTNGDTETGSKSAHWQINNVIIANNTLVNNYSNIEIGYGKSDNSWKKEPKNVKILNNIIYGGANSPVKIINSPSNFIWANNIMFPEGNAEIGFDYKEGEVIRIDPQLEYADSLWILTSTSEAIDKSNTDYFSVLEDFQGQKRIGIPDIGADEFSSEEIKRKPLTKGDVGPNYEIPTVVESDNTSVPQEFLLEQNYPNPFNPETTISYKLVSKEKVNLTVYNMLGQKVKELVNKVQNAGVYKVRFDAENLSSGVYLYRISVNGEISATKKMILLK